MGAYLKSDINLINFSGFSFYGDGGPTSATLATRFLAGSSTSVLLSTGVAVATKREIGEYLALLILARQTGPRK